MIVVDEGSYYCHFDYVGGDDGNVREKFRRMAEFRCTFESGVSFYSHADLPGRLNRALRHNPSLPRCELRVYKYIINQSIISMKNEYIKKTDSVGGGHPVC